MKKKYYIPVVIISAFLLFLTLPLLNYTTDQWRVLHKDYKQSYRGISPNKSFLKVAYLLDHKEKYDTILMGSSRSGYMDAGLISTRAYNMKFNFALASMHLHNLKILLKNKVKIKNLWLGVNDYVIWKNPQDHESDFQRRTYKENSIDQIDLYSFYLLKSLNDRDIKILKGSHRLSTSEEMTNPDKSNMKTARARETYALEHPDKWIKKMTDIKPTLLGYDDTKYRIDQVIEELGEIVQLCKENNIKLTVFFYPSYYKTYLRFNQYKIEEFKRKLVSLTDFYDFYELNDISFDVSRWQDSSHFHASVGDAIITTIQENKRLVTSENIEERIHQTRKLHDRILHHKLPIEYIYRLNAHMVLPTLSLLFDLKDNNFTYSTNEQLKFTKKNDSIYMTVGGIDPILTLNSMNVNSKSVILKCKIESPVKTFFQMYYKKTNTSQYNEADSYRVTIEKGFNEFNILIPSKYLHQNLRIDLADVKGKYKIKELSIHTL